MLRCSLLLVFVSTSGQTALSQGPEAPPLTRTRVADLAAAAPGARVAQFEAAVGRAAVSAAGTWSLDNPTVSGMGGFRWNPDGSRRPSVQASVSWPMDLFGQRGTRIDAAEAGYHAAKASAAGEKRRVVLLALLQHALVLRGQRAAEIAAARHALARRLFAAAQSRYEAGSVPELEVSLASLQEKRDFAAEVSALGTSEADRLILLALLGRNEESTVDGPLVPADHVPPLAMLLEHILENPVVRTAGASLKAAKAVADRESAAGWPSVSLLGQYQLDEGANTGIVGLSIPIPVLNANRSAVVTASAEVRVSEARMTQTRFAAEAQMKSLYVRYDATRKAVEALEPTAELATRAVTLATRGYELGEHDLGSVLLVRREALEAQLALLEAQYTHAAVKIELLVTSGRIPQ